MLDAFLDWLAGLPTALTYAVLAVLSALENVFPPVPADVAVALGAFLAQRGEISPVTLGVVCWLANTVSAAWIYGFARRRGPVFFRVGFGRRLVPRSALSALRDAFFSYGMAGIFFSRFLPGVRAAVMPFAGVVGLSPMRALVPAAAASALWYAGLIIAGTALGLNWEAVKELVGDMNRVLGLVALGFAALFGWWLWRRTRLGAASVQDPSATKE